MIWMIILNEHGIDLDWRLTKIIIPIFYLLGNSIKILLKLSFNELLLKH